MIAKIHQAEAEASRFENALQKLNNPQYPEVVQLRGDKQFFPLPLRLRYLAEEEEVFESNQSHKYAENRWFLHTCDCFFPEIKHRAFVES